MVLHEFSLVLVLHCGDVPHSQLTSIDSKHSSARKEDGDSVAKRLEIGIRNCIGNQYFSFYCINV